jgi:hypothetical protein
MNRVVHHYQHTALPACGVRCDRHRPAQIGGAVGTDRLRGAHSAGQHQRLWMSPIQIQQKRAFFERVGALSHHDPGRPLSDLLVRPPQNFQQIVERERRAGQLPQRLSVKLGDIGEVGNGVEQLLRGKLRYDAV